MAEVWKSLTAIDTFEESRQPVETALQQNLQTIVSDHIPSHGLAVEIGSGAGALRKRVAFPDTLTLVHLDTSPTYTVAMKQKYPDAFVIKADAYALPFADESVDAVISFSAFDTFADVQAGLEETKRILKPGKKFVHVLDLIPNPHWLLRDIVTDGYVPFPAPSLFHRVSPEATWRITKRADVQAFIERDTHHATAHQIIGEYMQNIRNDITKVNAQPYKTLATTLASVQFPGNDIRISEIFGRKMRRKMQTAGFKNVELGTALAQRFVLRNDAHDAITTQGQNVIINNIGTHSINRSSEVPEGIVLEVSVVQYITGEK